MTVNHLYPTTRPTLDLNFARQKRLDPRVTFTRGSTATYVGDDGLIKTAASNEARFDHDPTTGESLGLLMETSRTNGVIQSQDLTTWTKTNVTLDSVTATAPDGTSTAKKLIADTTNGTHRVQRGASISSSNVAFSFYAKAAEESVIVFAALNTTGNNRQAIFDLAAETATLVETDSTWKPRLEKYANGWYRCIVETTTSRVPTFVETFYIRTTAAWTGDGVGGLYIWGYQVEAGAFATSYIPTTSSTVTRATDLADITGTNFSSWYNQSEGSFHVNAKPVYNYQQYIFRTRFNNTIGVAVYLGGNDARSSLYVSGGSGAVNLNLASNIQNFAAGYKDYDFAVAGPNQILTNTTQTVPPYSLTSAEIGRSGLAQNLNGHIARIAYYPTRLTNSQLQELTR